MKKNLYSKATQPGIARAIKSVLLGAAVFIISIPVFSQPVLQSADLHTGMSFNIYALNNVNTSNLTTTGPNVTWDLSTATTGTLVGSAEFVDMASTGYAAQYPNANFAMKFTRGGVTSYNFDNTTSTVWEEVAINVGTSGLQTFLNNRTDLVFPFTYNRTDTDTYQKNGQSASTVSHIYDAYGSLVLSTGTLQNLVRIYSVDIGASTTQAIWWNASPVYPVLEADDNGILLWQLASANSINQVSKALSFSIYPNPAENQLHIVNTKPLSKLEIYDVTGQIQLTSTQSLIDISNLSSGVYIIKAFTADGIETTRFVKQ